MKTKVLMGSMVVLAIALPLLFQNCTNGALQGQQSATTNPSQSLVPTGAPQAAKIACNVVNNSGSTVQVVNSNSSMDQVMGSLTDANSGSSKIDCSGTQSVSSAQSNLLFYYTYNFNFTAPDSSPWTQASSPVINLKTLPASYIPNSMAIKVVDNTVNPPAISIKAFDLTVGCANPTDPDVSKAKLTVVKKSWNHFSYAVSGVVDANPAGLVYQFDFNGDSQIDPIKVGNTNTLSSSASIADVYNMYGKARNVAVEVINQCGRSKTFISNQSFDQKLIPDGGSASPMAFYYIQASVSAANASSNDSANDLLYGGNASQRNTADVLATYDSNVDQFRHVICEYNQVSAGSATFKITGLNNYAADTNDTANSSAVPYDHNLSLTVANIADDEMSNMAATSFDSAAGVIKVTSAGYKVSAIDKAASSDTYITSNGCQVKLTVQHGPPGACTGGTTGIILPAVSIYGDYSCPSLPAATGKSVQLKNGHFFCQRGPDPQCVGGGQEGGGPPPAQ